MQPVQDLTVDDRVSRTEYQYTLEDPNQAELDSTAQTFVAQLKKLPQLSDVVTDQQLGGSAASLVIDRATASRFGITPETIDNTLYDAFGQRQINTLYTQLNQYHVILETDPKFQLSPERLRDIYIQSSTTSTTSGQTATTTSGSSAGAGSGAATSSGNATLTPSNTNGVTAGSSATSALSSTNATTTGALSTTASNALTTTSTTSTVASGATSTSANTATSGTTRSGSGTTTAAGSATGSSSGGGGGTTTTTAQATPVPLSAFTHIQNSSESLSINHQGQFPAVTVSFNLNNGYSLGQALTAIDKVVKQADFPKSVVADYQGTAAAFKGSESNEGLLILAALVTVYIVLGVLVRELSSIPVTILSTLPSAGVGALLCAQNSFILISTSLPSSASFCSSASLKRTAS